MIRFALAALALSAAAPAVAEPAPASPAAPAGALIGPALNVGNLERTLHFYVDGLGMSVGSRRGGPKRLETILTFGDPRAGVLLLMSDGTARRPSRIVPGHGFDRLVMRMTDLDSTAARLRAAGFAPGAIRSSMQGAIRVMDTADPDGYRLELVETRTSRAGATP